MKAGHGSLHLLVAVVHGQPRICLPCPGAVLCLLQPSTALHAQEPRDPDVTPDNVLTQMPAGGGWGEVVVVAVAHLPGMGAGGSASPLS